MAGTGGRKSDARASRDNYHAMGTGPSPTGTMQQRRFSVTVAMAGGGSMAALYAAAGGAGGTGGTGSSTRSGTEGRDSLQRAHLGIADEINPRSLTFKNADLEVAFDLFHRELFVGAWRRVWPVAVLIVLLLQARTAMYYAFVSHDAARVLWSTLIIVLGALLPFLLAVSLAVRPGALSTVAQRWQALLTVAAAVLFAIATVLLAYISDDDAGLSLATYLLVLIAWTFPSRARLFPTAAATLPATVAYCIYFGLLAARPPYERYAGILYICVIYVAFIVVVYDQELSLRHHFVHSSFLLRSNAKLKDQLNHLKGKYTKTGADFDSPLEKVNAMMNSLLADSTLGAEQLRTVANALHLINTTNVLQPDLDGQIKAGQVHIDRDTEAWLFTELAQRERAQTANARKAAQNSTRVDSPYFMSGLNFEFNPFDAILEGLDLDAEDAKQAHALLQQAEVEYNFNIFELDRVTKGHALSVLAMHLFLSHGLLQTFELPLNRLRNFIRKIESGYRNNPYHNAVHAADVLHATNYFLHHSDLKETVNDMDRLCAFVAAIVHDYDHPGLSNVFQVNARTTKAIVYNDRSVLENHHLAASFLAMESEENNFVSHFSRDKFKEFRHAVIELVLATDLAQHFKILSQFKAKCQADGHLDLEKTEDRILVMQIVIKCADVSNGSKSSPIYRKWTGLVMEEFYRQGDEERRLGLQISPFMDREQPKLAQCQKGFLEFICLPLFEAFDGFVNIPEIFAQLQSNAAYWASQVDAPERPAATSLPMPSSPPPAAPPAFRPSEPEAGDDSKV